MGYSATFGMVLLTTAGLVVASAACDAETESGDSSSTSSGTTSSSGSSSGTTSTSSSGSVGGGDPDGGTGGGATFGSGSNFGSVNEFFAYVNEERENYVPHDRWSGFPFTTGYYHTNVTWPVTMIWSDTAVAAAQAEADAVAGGASPSGEETFANPGQLPVY
ncbi:MAG: hypothetical protein JRI68_33910, partial [Deltaproteobacteria bacterium]|nr:hypothetical protein [Deltaproteobacteria bacterium]